MHFVLIVAICIGLSADGLRDGVAPLPVEQVGERLAAMAFGIGFVLLFAMVIATAIRSQLVDHFDRRGRILGVFQRLQWVHMAVALVIYAVLIHWVQWPTLVRVNWRLGDLVVLDELAILAPFLVMLVGAWVSFYRVDRVMRVGLSALFGERGPRVWSRRQFVSFKVRHYLLLVLVPALVLFAASDLVERYAPPAVTRNDLFNLGAMACVAATLLALSPLLIRALWHARPLPEGPIRDRLERLARRAGFGYRDILLWDTGGAVVNAAVTGVFGRLRYVLLSDALSESLTPEEIEAVFGHEIGHVRHHHMFFFFFFVVAGVVVIMFTADVVGRLLTGLVGMDPSVVHSEILNSLPFTVFAVTLYFGLVFGFISRRFERQADVFACRVLTDAEMLERAGWAPASPEAMHPWAVEVFAQALEKVAYLNGMSRNLRSWRHFSIARRVDFLRDLATNPATEGRFQRSLVRLKLSMVLGVSCIAAYLLLI